VKEGLRGGRWVFGEVILERGILGLRLILTGCEHNHVVECTRFHRYAFSQNHYAHDISRVVARGAVAWGVEGCSLDSGCSLLPLRQISNALCRCVDSLPRKGSGGSMHSPI